MQHVRDAAGSIPFTNSYPRENQLDCYVIWYKWYNKRNFKVEDGEEKDEFDLGPGKSYHYKVFEGINDDYLSSNT